MKLEISIELAQAIANYLQEKPYKEVHGLLAELTKLQKIEDNNEA